ncbi:MAG: M20 family metallopeptidase [Gammaproteobacteria bacterium]
MTQSVAREILSWLQSRQDELVDFILQLVRIESPSDVPAAQQPVFELLSHEIQKLNYRIVRIPGKLSGGHLFARPLERIRNKPVQLLLGHCDTVWPMGTLEKMPIVLKDGMLHGPGIYDMKTGLAQMIFALRALQELHYEPALAPLLFINSDEEIGSRESSRYIHWLARLANRSLVSEPSLGPRGRIKTARKGVGRFTVTVKGKAAHAGLNPEAGASAILELSHVIQKLFDLNDIEKGITVNVGTLEGGLRANVVARVSTATTDVRVLTRRDAEDIEQAILAIKPTLPGVTLEIQGRMGRPPMEKTPANRKIWELAITLAEELDMQLEEGTAGGASDGNTASLYHATLDGLGAVGDGAHALHEHIDLSKLAERSALLALLILAPALD